MTGARHEAVAGEVGLFYRFVRAVFNLFFLVIFRKKVLGVENIPKEGSIIVCSNHISWFDPTLVACAVGGNRQICFMAKEELFKIPVFNCLITKLGAFPVKRRKTDRKAIQHAMDVLKSKRSLGVFPEGPRSKKGGLQKAYHGPAPIILRSEVPVLPIAIKGPYKLFQPIKISIGKPLYLKCEKQEKGFKREQIRKVSSTIMGEIGKLLNEI